jgi:putative tricarboxylic transport membrane protein
MRRYDLISSILFMVGGGVIVAVALRLNVGTLRDPGPGLFPIITGILMSLIAAGTFAQACVRAVLAGPGHAGRAAKLWHGKSAATVGIMLLYAYALEWAGFLTVTLLMLLVLFKAIAGLNFRASVGGAILATAVAYLVFKVWLKVQLPAGPLGP